MLSSNNYYNSSNSIKQNTLPSPPIHQHVEHTMTRDQQKYCGAIMKNLKKHRDASPFLNPVDYVKLNVPDYPSIVKHPMDLLLVDSKLNACEYANVDEFVADVRLVFNNCFKYNGPEAMISVLCQNVESAFEKSLRQMPLSNIVTTTKTEKHSQQQMDDMKKEPSPPLSQHNSPPPLLVTESYKTTTTTTTTTISEDLGRPKREIHCPSKDYPETFTTQRKLSHANKTSLHMKFCFQVLKELKKNKYRNQIYPFLNPVDPVALNLPDYTTIVKHPMDLSTIEEKLLNDEYKGPDQFEQDMSLMFNNCYLYNPPSLPIYSMAQDMEKVFRNKWAQRPLNDTVVTPPPVNNNNRKRRSSSIKQQQKKEEVESELEEEEVDDGDEQIAQLERTLQAISQQLESIVQHPKKKSVPTPKKQVRRANSSTTTLTKTSPPVKRKRVTKKTPVTSSDNEEEEEEQDEQRLYKFTYKEMQDLGNRINDLDQDELGIVAEIIQKSMPHLANDGQEELELDIEALDNITLHRLSNFVNFRKPKYNKPKKQRVHYSEKAADKKIHELEQTLKKFESSDSSSSGSEDEDGSSGSSDSDSD